MDFVGYSLPQNDYEFKHILKIAELKLSHKKKTKLNIDVVLLNSDSTAVRYKSFLEIKSIWFAMRELKNI